MVKADGVEAYMIRYDDKTLYTEYAAPSQSPAYTGRQNEVYIEAETGVRFAIAVRRGSDFKFLRQPDVETTCDIDGKLGKVWLSQSSFSKGSFTTAKEHTFESHRIVLDGAWTRCGFTFNQLALDELLELSADEVTRDAGCHGKIVVTVTRGKSVRRNIPEMLARPRTDVRTSSTEIVKDKQITHALQHVPLSASEPAVSNATFTAASKAAVTPICFVFYARSKTALQLMKIMPEDHLDTSNDNAIGHVVHNPKERVVHKSEENLTAGNVRSPAEVGKVDKLSTTPSKEHSCMPPLDIVTDAALKIETNISDDEIKIVDVRTAPGCRQSINTTRIKGKGVAAIVPPARVKRERPPTTKPPVASTGTPSAEQPGQPSKQRKKARLQLELDEIRAKRELEEIQVRKRLVELDDSE